MYIYKNLSAKYYEENKERLKIKRKLVKDINIFLNEKKKRKRHYGRECYKNLLEDKKDKLVVYRKNIAK